MLTGRLIIESLRVGAVVAVPEVRVTSLGRHDVSGSTAPEGGPPGEGSGEATGATDAQPSVWTFLDFEAPDERADEIAAALAGALDPVTGWYTDFRVGDDNVIVFSDRVFRYRIGDRRGREEAVAWGRAAGTPVHQLDWGD